MKKLKLLFVMLFALSSNCFAQFAVLDAANLLNSIEQLYQFYQQIQASIEQVQNTYKQIEMAAKNVTTMNFNDLKDLGSNFSGLSENPFEAITAVHKSAQDITKAVEKNMNKVNALQQSLTKKSISFGGMDVSVADLCGWGEPEKDLLGFTKNAWQHSQDTAEKAAAGYVGKLTYKQKQAIMKRYGMSPINYAKLQMGNEMLSNLVKESNVQTSTEGLKQMALEVQSEMAAMNQIIENTTGMESQAAVAQAGAQAAALTAKNVSNMNMSITKGFGMLGQWITGQKSEEYMKMQQEAEETEKKKKQLNQDSS